MRNKIFLLLVLGASALTCPKYPCATTATANNLCSAWSLEAINLTVCESGKICPLPKDLGGETYCVKSASHPQFFAGEQCDHSAQCFGNLECRRQFCRLKDPAHAKCNRTVECDIESYCNGTNCVKAVAEGEACGGKAQCRSNAFCLNGNCTRIGALEDGDSADVAAQCQSHYIRDGKCSPGPTLENGETYECKGSCVYKLNDGTTITTSCACGKTTDGKAFCPPGIGDIKVASIGDYFESEQRLSCHLDRGPFCTPNNIEDMSQQYLMAYIAYTELTDPSVVLEGNDCIKEMYYKNYWDAKTALKDLEDDFGFMLFVVVTCAVAFLIAIMLIIYFVRRRKENSYEGTNEIFIES